MSTTISAEQFASLSPVQQAEYIKALQEENAKLKANKASAGSSIKVSTKGAVSVYGLGRFPVTLYSSQWEALLSKADDIKAFIQTNRAILKEKE